MDASAIKTNSSSGSSHSRWILVILILLIVIAHVLFVLFCIILKPSSKHIPMSDKCGPEHLPLSEDLSNAQRDVDGSLLANGIVYPPGTFWTKENYTRGCPCLFKTCIKKCCPENQRFATKTNVSCVVDESLSPIYRFDKPIFFKPQKNQSQTDFQNNVMGHGDYYVISEKGCNEEGQYGLGFRFEIMNEKTFLMIEGTILTENLIYIDLDSYCFDTAVGDDNIISAKCVQNTFVYNVYTTKKSIAYLFLVLMCASLSFLLMTLVIYACIPQLRNLHGKLLMCHTASLMCYFLSILLTEHAPKLGSFCIQFFLVARTTWLTAACFELWWIFSRPLKNRRHSKQVQWRKFILYSIFGWGLPTLSILLSAAVGIVPDHSDSCPRPRFKDDPCFFTVKKSFLLFISFPMFLMVSINLIMFLFTLFHIRSHFRAMKALPSSRSRSFARERFWLYVRLSLLMGINWFVMEIFYIEDLRILNIPIMFYIVVAYTLAQGIMQFVLLVFCNRRVLHLVCDRWFLWVSTTSSSSSQRGPFLQS